MDHHNINMLVWNVRGLNARCRHDSLRVVANENNVSVLCVQETKLSVISDFLINEMLGNRFAIFDYLPVAGTRDGILIACRSPEVSCSRFHLGTYSVTVTLNFAHEQEQFCLTGVYGPQADVDKVEFLNELRSIQSMAPCPWLLAGDFNLILDATDKNNANLNRRKMGRFRWFVDDAELKDLHLHGRRYTWSNGCTRPTLEKLDRVPISVDWESLFPDCFLQALSSDMSDHTPLLLATNARFRPKRRFQFENFWIRIPGYIQAVEKGCNCPPSTPDPFG
jgi:exonuclease III